MPIASVFDSALLPRSEYPPPPASLLTKWLFIGLPIDVKLGRGWSFRAWRLQRYLANNPDVTAHTLPTAAKASTQMADSSLVVDDDPHIRESCALPSKKPA